MANDPNDSRVDPAPFRWNMVAACAQCGAPYWLSHEIISPNFPPPLIASCLCFPERGMPSTAGSILMEAISKRMAQREPKVEQAQEQAPLERVIPSSEPWEPKDAEGKPHPEDHDLIPDLIHMRQWHELKCMRCGWTEAKDGGRVS